MAIFRAANIATIGATLYLITMAAAAATGLKVGVLVPSAIYHSALNEQIKAAGTISADVFQSKHNAELDVKFVHGPFDKTTPTKGAYTKLLSEGVDVIVGGMTPMSAEILARTASSLMAKGGTPTIIFSVFGDAYRKADSGDAANILKLGVPSSVAYSMNLKHWIKDKDIKTLSVLYGGNQELTFKYGAKLTIDALKPLGTKLRLTDIALFPKLWTGNTEKLLALKKGSVDAIIMSSRYNDKVGLFSAFQKGLTKLPVFIAPPFASQREISELARKYRRLVYYSTQFWPDRKDKAAREFLNEMGKKLNWEKAKFVHPHAVRVHDAVQIAGKAWLSWREEKAEATRSWSDAQIERVQGASGELELLDGHVMAGPVGLLSGGPDGKIVFERTPVAW